MASSSIREGSCYVTLTQVGDALKIDISQSLRTATEKPVKVEITQETVYYNDEKESYEITKNGQTEITPLYSKGVT